ncbi:hypothetical protein [Fictibacillus terranigra]|uniref:Spore coat protein W n=1 Tax=Fictibacillus terranigra TaxID=3058424 RepID=A0ABT8E6W6_9BACL|nr:hypothetical protein [Fictibacillus sp. CENA-BCM004]MDN4073658.1 hypothetical protein [Fictibacillus sp. CENA-BCM004]
MNNEKNNQNNPSFEETKLLVQSLFIKHGITKEKLQAVTEEQKQQLKDTIDQLNSMAETLKNPAKANKTKARRRKRFER